MDFGKILKSFLDIIYPRRCPVCDRPLKLGTRVCTDCEKTLVYASGTLCLKCGKKLYDENEEYCDDCKKNKHIYKAGRSLYEYDSISKSIYKFKYGGRSEYGEFYADKMAEKYENLLKLWGIEMIIPVPLHSSKLKKRGYNQADILARRLALRTNIPYCPDLVIRDRKTLPLKELGASERQINLKNAFIVGYNDVKLNKVLIIDDIYTTGSTIDAIAQVLLNVGVSEVYFLSLSIGAGI